MPIIATPVTPVTQGGTQQGIAQINVAGQVTSVEGALVPAKMQALTVAQTQQAVLTWVMVDRQGNAVDLTTLAGYAVQFLIREALSTDPSLNPGTLLAGAVANAAAGVVQTTLTAAVVAVAGVSVVEVGLFGPPPTTGVGPLVFSNRFFLFVEPSQFGTVSPAAQPPTVGELRLYLRDVDPAGNLWRQSFEWDVAELVACLTRPVLEFNEALPPLDQQYNTATFPWRHNWIHASQGYLMRLAADWYRRVHLPYQGGGLSVDDNAKFQEYDARGRELLEEWRDWLKHKKVQLNADGAYQSQGSSYSNMGWY